jgi:hypothetical protein
VEVGPYLLERQLARTSFHYAYSGVREASSLFLFVFAALFVFSSGYASAATLTIGWQTSTNSNTYQAVYLDSSSDGNYVDEEANPDPKTYGPDATIDEWSGSYSNAYLTVSYDIHFDEDPTVVSFFSLQNNSGFTNTFTMTVNQPVSPTIISSLGSGSTGFTLTAVNPGATLDAPLGSALYNAQINGGTVQSLFPGTSPSTPPLPVSTTPTNSTTINANFSGQPEGPASIIGIFNNFTLTNGDLASATSIFKIDAAVAPEPASITLSLLGLLGIPLALRLRRR